MRIITCICSKCACVGECPYYNETIYPIMNAVKYAMSDVESFEAKIIDALADFTCEYFE